MDQHDFLYSTSDVAIWSCTETGFGITAACCATLRPLVRTFIASNSASASNNKHHGHSNTALSDGRVGRISRERKPGWNVETHIGRHPRGYDFETEELQLDQFQDRGVVAKQCLTSTDSTLQGVFFREDKIHTKEFPSME